MPPISFNLYLHDVPADAEVKINLHVYAVSTDPQVQAAINAETGELRTTNDALDAALTDASPTAPA